MSAQKFWMIWLKIVVIILNALGVIFLVFNQSPLFIDFFEYMSTHYPSEQLPIDSIAPMQGWILSGIGILMVNWGIVMIYMTWYPIARGEIKALHFLIVALLVWVILDASFALYFGMFFIVLFDVVAFFVMAAPLLSLLSLFNQKRSKSLVEPMGTF